MLCVSSIPIHHDSHAADENAVIQIQHAHAETIDYPGAQESSGQGGYGKGTGSVEKDPFLPYICSGPSHGISPHDVQRRSRDLRSRRQILINASPGHEKYEHRHADKPPAYAYQRAKDAHAHAQQQEQDEFQAQDHLLLQITNAGLRPGKE